MKRGSLAAAAAGPLAAVLTGCGTGASPGSDATLESWRAAACPLLVPAGGGEASPPERLTEAREALASVRAIPVPDEQAADIEKLLDLIEQAIDDYQEKEPKLTLAERERCGSRGEPVSVQEFVDIFNEHGSRSSSTNASAGSRRRSARPASTRTRTTERGDSERDDAIERDEGFVPCSVTDDGVDHELGVNKYKHRHGDTLQRPQRRLHAHPHSTAVEREQVARVRQAMQAVKASVPKP